MARARRQDDLLPALRQLDVAAVLLVHGAGSGPWVYDGWHGAFGGEARVEAVDLQEGLDVARASMADYAAAVTREARILPRPLAVCGWSLGGLAAMLSAQHEAPDALVLIEASAPAEAQGVDSGVLPTPGTFHPEEVYGAFPAGMRSRPESSFARAERKRGIPVRSLPCPTLVVDGSDFPDERGRDLARLYGAAELAFPELDHWQLVLDPRVPAAVAAWLADPGSRIHFQETA